MCNMQQRQPRHHHHHHKNNNNRRKKKKQRSIATRACPSVNWNGPSRMPVVVDCLSSDLKNIALVIMVRNSNDMQHDSRCTRVKLERVGREKTESQRWSLASFLRAEEVKRCLKAMRSSMPATGRIRSTMPSSSSTASQRSHRKIDLRTGTRSRHLTRLPSGAAFSWWWWSWS